MGNTNLQNETYLDKLFSCLQQANLCLRPEYQSDELVQFTQSHNYITLYTDPYYGDCHILQDKNNQAMCVVMKQTLDRKDHQAKIDRLNQIIICGEGPANRNIIRVNILADLEKVGFLWRKNQLYVKYDYILFDLEKEFEYRISNNTQFSQAEIKTIIRQCTKGYLRLQLTKYTSVRMKHIYFCDDGAEIKLAHPKLFNYRSNLQILSEDYQKKNIYLSPQEIYALQISDYQYECGWSSNSFSFGMIVLSLMTMKHLNDVYNYKSCQINFKKINELITVCNNKYSYHLINIVKELLSEKQSQRLMFRYLYNKIDNNQTFSAPIELELIQEKKEEEKYVVQKRIQDILPKYPNYIAALIKPKVDLNGQYMSINNQEDIITQKRTEIVADKRMRYSTNHRQSYGSYLGEAVNRQSSAQKNESIRHGKGVYQYIDGQTYIGQWKDGKMHGSGKLYYSNKKLRYDGEFKHGLFHGNGTQYAQNQIEQREDEIDQEYIKIFQGNWLKYEGYYVNDKKEGAGKVYFRNGFWRGNFKKGQPNGEGIYTCYAKNKAVKGQWADGQLIKRK